PRRAVQPVADLDRRRLGGRLQPEPADERAVGYLLRREGPESRVFAVHLQDPRQYDVLDLLPRRRLPGQESHHLRIRIQPDQQFHVTRSEPPQPQPLRLQVDLHAADPLTGVSGVWAEWGLGCVGLCGCRWRRLAFSPRWKTRSLFCTVRTGSWG